LYDLNSHHGTHVLRSGELVSTPVQPEKSIQLFNNDLITFGKSVDANGKVVRPVTARVELIMAEKAPIAGSHRNSQSPRAKNTSGRYGISIPLHHDDDVASTSSDDSDIEELPVRPASLYMDAWQDAQDTSVLENCGEPEESLPCYTNNPIISMPSPSLPEPSWSSHNAMPPMPQAIDTPISSVPLWFMSESHKQVESRSPSPDWSDEEDNDDNPDIHPGNLPLPSGIPVCQWPPPLCTLPRIHSPPQTPPGLGFEQGHQNISSMNADNQNFDDQEQDHSSVSDSDSIFDRCMEDIDGLKADVDNAKVRRGPTYYPLSAFLTLTSLNFVEKYR
jgi:hypothetical protein